MSSPKENESQPDHLIFKLSEALSIKFEKMGSLTIIVMAALLTIEITARNLFNYSTLIAYDLTGLLLGCMTFLGFAESFRSKTHIRVDFLTTHFSEKRKAIARLAASLLGLVYGVFILTYTGKLALNSLRLQATSYTSLPILLWPFQFIVPLGTLVFILILLRDTIALMKTMSESK